MAARLRNYQADDGPAVVDLWNRSLVHDPITLEIFEDKVLLDPNFDVEGCKVAEDGGRVVGFVHAVVRTTPYPRGFASLLEADRDRGWIVGLCVHPEQRGAGIGSALLKEGLGFLRSKGRKKAILFSYTPNYLLVGVDAEGYPGALEFFKRHGFAPGGESVGMAVDLQGLSVPPAVRETEAALRAEGIRAQYFERRYILPTVAFFERHFPTWLHYFLDKLDRRHDLDEMVIVLKGDDVVSYCQHRYYQHVERTGPFGVSPDLRGKHVGTVMLYKLLERMAQKGYKCGWFTSTDLGTANYYAKAGYRVVRKHVGMSRDL
jgi:ribosomal protein S18 acetylase RimI-like enzyme